MYVSYSKSCNLYIPLIYDITCLLIISINISIVNYNQSFVILLVTACLSDNLIVRSTKITLLPYKGAPLTCSKIGNRLHIDLKLHVLL